MWDKIKLRIPMKIGDVVLKVTMARFSRTLSTLLAAGGDSAAPITGRGRFALLLPLAAVAGLACLRLKTGGGLPFGP